MVNGVFSSKTTLNTPPTSAKFEFNTTLEYPYYITYGTDYTNIKLPKSIKEY